MPDDSALTYNSLNGRVFITLSTMAIMVDLHVPITRMRCTI